MSSIRYGFNLQHFQKAKVTPSSTNHIIHLVVETMREFCCFGPNSSRKQEGDWSDLRSAGFFSSNAIEAAVRQASINVNSNNNNDGISEEKNDGEEDDDGT